MPDGGKRRYPRTERDLGEALLRHLSLLREFGRRAFDEGDDKFLGEVAAKLRLLCYRQGRNRPLLLDMMARYQSKVRCVSRVPPDMGRTRPLEEYLDEVCMVTPGPMAQSNSRTRSSSAVGRKNGVVPTRTGTIARKSLPSEGRACGSVESMPR